MMDEEQVMREVEELDAAYESEDQVRRKYEEGFRSKKAAKQFLDEQLAEYNALDPEVPGVLAVRRVIKVLQVSSHGDAFELAARCVRSDGIVDIIRFSSWQTYGSRHEPPDGETTIEWDGLDADNKPVRYICLTRLHHRDAAGLVYHLRRAGVRARTRTLRVEVNAAQLEKAKKVIEKRVPWLKV